MLYEDFVKEYRSREEQLERRVKELKRILDSGLETYWQNRPEGDSGRPRVRIREARAKDLDSLYKKINDDRQRYDFRKIFTEPGHLRDLIGARIVCQTLSDLHSIAESLKGGKLWRGSGVNNIRTGGEKNWVVNAKQDSGYRGLHLDLLWDSGEDEFEFDQAELQLRTMLQDVYAVMMHADIYKSDVPNVFPPRSLSYMIAFSNVLFSFDQIADEFRHEAQDRRIAHNSALTITDAIESKMYALAASKKTLNSSSKYISIKRIDEYIVHNDGSGTFTFTIEGISKETCDISFPIVGDTPFKNTHNIEVYKMHRSGQWIDVTDDISWRTDNGENINESNAIIMEHKNVPRKQHKYKVRLNWNGVFEHDIDHVWCPWLDLYPGSEVEYSLYITFERKPGRPPLLVDVSRPDVHRLRDLIRSYSSGQAEHMELVESSVTAQEGMAATYSKSGLLTPTNYLCLITTPK